MKVVKNYWLLFFLLPFLVQGQTADKIEEKQKEIKQIESVLTQKKEELSEYKLEDVREKLKTVGYPISPFKGEIVEHSAMVLEYIEKHEQASWVYHIILRDIIGGTEGRTNIFMEDEKVSTGTAIEQDYFLKETRSDGSIKYDGYGYDRGHLAPSADFRWNAKALGESYYYSNMSPQLAEFNRGTWSDIESLLRKYIFDNKTDLYVVTGGVLEDDLPVLERSINKITIPRQYYKVALDPVNNKGIAFLVPNIKELGEPREYITSISEIEKVTGIKFFSNISIADSVKNNVDFDKFLGSDYLKSEYLPLDPTKLPRKTFNTIQSKLYAGNNDVITVCGTVAGKNVSSKGNVFLNLDKNFPNTVFSVFIKKEFLVNFSYEPDKKLFKECICVTGKVGDFNGTPTMNVSKEQQIKPCPEFP
jgi:endonuclease G